jgi:hypothetical protein
MQINDFHSKLKNEEGHLFEALRSLTQIEDPKAMLKAVPDVTTMGEWVMWPPMDARASCAASAGV